MGLLSQTENRIHKTKILSKKEIARDAYEYVFPLPEKFNYVSGQYVWVKLDLKRGRSDRRAFSIVGKPADDHFAIVFRNSKSEYKKKLMSLGVGDEIEIIGPFGFSFVLPEKISGPIVLIAGGTGVTPFLSIWYMIQGAKKDIKSYLIYSERNEEYFIHKDKLEALSKDNKNLHLQLVISEIKNSDLEKVVNLKNAKYYVSGPQSLINKVYEFLKSKNIPDNQIFFESFYPESGNKYDILNLFENGKPRIDNDESEKIKNKTGLIYSLVEASPSHILITDKDGRIIFANKAAQEITGYSIQEMLGNTPRLWGGLMSRDFYENLWKLKKDDTVINTEVINRRKNGELYVARAHITSIRNENRDIIGFIATEEDITELRKQEEELFARNNEAERLNKITIGRELKMIELKERIRELESKINHENKG